MPDIIQKFFELLHGFDLVWALILTALATAAWWLVGEKVYQRERQVKWRLLIGVLAPVLIICEILLHNYLLASYYVFPNNVAGILVLRISGDDEHNTFRNRLVSSLNTELASESVAPTIEVRRSDTAIDENALGLTRAHEKARTLGRGAKAQLVVWGTTAGDDRFFPRLTIVQEPSASLLRSRELTLQVQNVRELNLPSAVVARPIILARLSAGIALLAQGDFQRSLDYLNPALQLPDLEGSDRAPLLIFAAFDHVYLAQVGTVDARHLREAAADFATAAVWYKENNFLDIWALTEAWLGSAYGLCASVWMRSDDLDAAVAAYRQSITVFSEANEPELYAGILNNIATLYTQCPTRDYPQHVCAAIPALTTALRSFSHHTNLTGWAIASHNLAAAYHCLTTGDSDQNQWKAIRLYKDALLVRTEDTSPLEWAWTQNGLGLAYSSLSDTNDPDAPNRGISCYKAALRVLTQTKYPQYWAIVQFNMGLTYAGLPSTGNAVNTRTAIECYAAALRQLTKEKSPYWWARIQDSLGEAYASLSTISDASDCRKGIATCEEALQVLDETNYPRDWANLQNHLASAYLRLASISRPSASAEAVACYLRALHVFTESDYPDHWVTCQVGLSAAYADLAVVTNRNANIENSCTAAQAALSSCTETTDPEHWAAAQCNLANACRASTTGDPVENEQFALDSYQAGLRVYTRDKFRREWALTQINLGLLYINAHTGEKTDNMLKAAEFLQSGVSASTADECGQIWAQAQLLLGMAFSQLGLAEKDDYYLDMAQTAIEQSLRFYTAEDYPQMWSAAESLLGAIHASKYETGAMPGKPAHLQLAQEHLQRALTVPPSLQYDGEREAELSMLAVVTNELAKLNATNSVATHPQPPGLGH